MKNKKYELLMTEGFHLGVRDKLIFKEDQSLPAAAASCLTEQGFILIIYNPILLQEYDEALIPSIASHELYHYLYNHLHEAIKAMKDKTKDQQKTLMACDCEVNSHLPELCFGGHVWPEKFKLEKYLDWETYYNLLPDPPKQPADGQGCSLGAAKEVLKRLKEAAGQEGHTLKKIKTPPGKPIEPVKNSISGIRNQIERLMGQMLDARICKQRMASKPHKWKTGGYGKAKRYQPRLAFLIDCSGSTTGEQVKKYYSLVRQLIKEYAATVIEFDDSIRHVGKRPSFKSWGGGTVFETPAKYCDARHFDAVIWFTDGDGQMVKTKAKSLFVLTAQNAKEYISGFGKVLRA